MHKDPPSQKLPDLYVLKPHSILGNMPSKIYS